MLEPGDPDFETFGGGPDDNGPEDELDAFNDDTFGAAADEWKEDTHEELAQLTEEERKALKASNDFFEFGEDDEGECLEPETGGLDEEDEGGCLDSAADQLLGALKPKAETQGDSSSVGGDLALNQQFQQLKLRQVAAAAPLTIQTSQPPLVSVHQHAAPPTAVQMFPAPPAHQHLQIIQQPHYQMQQQQQQQVRYNLVPATAAHFQSNSDPNQLGVHPHQHSLQQGAGGPPLQDPAIMSFSKVPVMAGLGGQPQPQQHNQPPSHYHTGQPTSHYGSAGQPMQYSGAGQQVIQQQLGHQPPPQQPLTVMGFKTMQDIENEIFYGKGGAGSQHHPANQQQLIHHQNMKQKMFSNRNLNYPGMRDRQQASNGQSPRNNFGASGGNHGGHGSGGYNNNDRQGFDRQGYQNNRQGYQNDRQNFQNDRQGFQNDRQGFQNDRQGFQNDRQGFQNDRQGFQNDRQGFQNDRQSYRNDRQQDRSFHNNDQRGAFQQRPHADIERRNQMNDSELRYNNNVGPDQDRQHYRQHQDNMRQSNHSDENNWRWNEVRNRNRDSATRKDLMPGHVHTLGILRHSRLRHSDHPGETGGHHVDPEDDCLGSSDTAPLLNPTGDPALDARLAAEQEELTNRARWFNETEDEYAGLMSAREKQIIINIQLSQINCDNPYVDDYYYTMFIAKKQKLDESERTGQMLLSDSSHQENSYIPMQFENSLGKLQVVTVKAPRQIIDVGVVRSEELSAGSPVVGGVDGDHTTPPSTLKPKRGEDYKRTLLQLESMYTNLLDLESIKLKLSAIPTGVPLREQVTHDMTREVERLASSLSRPGLVPLYLQIRKGRGLLARVLKHLPSNAVSRISQEMLVHLWLVCKDVRCSELMWNHVYRHCASSSLGHLEAGVNCWVKGKESAINTMLTSPLGVSTVLQTLYRATSAAKRGQEKICVSVWRELVTCLISWYSVSTNCLASPLVPPQPLDIGFLLTLPDKQKETWELIMASVGLEK